MSTLPGVKVGPLDPDATESFGQVAQQNTARQLIRLHAQMYPPQLRRALSRPQDDAHSKAASENLELVHEYVSRLERENGDPVVPDGSRIVGAAVRGDRSTGQVLTFQWELPSGRIGKWFAPYTPEALPDVHEIGSEYARVQQLKDRGVVAYDEQGTNTEILRRQLANSRAENERLRRERDGGQAEPQATPAGEDDQAVAGQLEEVEQLRREVAELREKAQRFDQLSAASGGGLPIAGVEADLSLTSRNQRDDAAGEEQTIAQEPPFEGYEDLNAAQLQERIKSEDTSDDEVRAIVAYERSHANRRTVVSSGEQRLDRASGE